MAIFTRAFVAYMQFNTAGFEKTITRERIVGGKQTTNTEEGFTKSVANIATYLAEVASNSTVVPVAKLNEDIAQEVTALLTPAKDAATAGLKNSVKVSMVMRAAVEGDQPLLTFMISLKSNSVKTTHYVAIDTGVAGG
jgi:hypothetical protein